MSRQFVRSRDDFQTVLAGARDEVRALADRGAWWPLESILLQLEAMRSWTDGREPTRDEIASIQLGVVVARELEPAETPELELLNERLYELHGYFKEWLGDDEEVDDLDGDDDEPAPQDGGEEA